MNSISFFTIVSLLMPSASALKLVTMRCRKHRQRHLADVFGADVISALEQRPGLAGEDQVLAGRGPAPQPTKSFTKSGTVPSVARVSRVNCSA